MIYLSGPVHTPQSTFPRIGPELSARYRRVDGPGRPKPPSWTARLNFYRIAHPLTWRLEPYRATTHPSMMRRASWQTLLYWQQLFDVTEVEVDLRETVRT